MVIITVSQVFRVDGLNPSLHRRILLLVWDLYVNMKSGKSLLKWSALILVCGT